MNASEYFEGYLKAFSFHSDENALRYMCTKSETSSIQDDEEEITTDSKNYEIDRKEHNEEHTTATEYKQMTTTEKSNKEDKKDYTYRYIMKEPGTDGLIDIEDMEKNVIIKDAIKLTNELAILPNGDIVATKPEIENQRVIIAENIKEIGDRTVFETKSGQIIKGAAVDDQGIITLPNNTLTIEISNKKDRYIIQDNPENKKKHIFDRRIGMELTNATLHHNGMIRLATGQLVAPSSREGSKYMVVTDEDDQTLLVYDRFTGEQIKGAQVDANGLIRFEDGRMAVEPSSKLDRYAILTDPNNGEKLVFDRRTGDHIKDAVYSEDGLIRFTDGRRVAPGSTDNSSQYLIYFDPATKENLVFDRHTGEQIEGATVDSRGLILLPDGKLHLDQNQVKHRYIVLQDVAENATFVVDTKSGQKIDGATVLINGLVKLPDGSLVAPGSNISTNYMVIEPADGEENSMVFDRRTGEQITDAYVDKDGVINLPDGSLAISASETTDRYLVAQDKLTGDPVIFDRRTGMELTNATLHHNGMIRLATGQLVAPSSREGSKYMVVTDEDDQTLLVYDRFTGEQIKGAQVDANGLIRFEDGRMAVEPSSKLDRYAILTDPNNGEKLVFDRRTGDHIKDAVYSEDGLIRFTDGRRVAPGSTDNSSQYLIYFDPATKENLVFDRHTGEQIEGATVDSRGLILLPDGKLHLDQNQVKHRYIVLQDVAENATFVVDTKSGQKIDGATVLINGLVKLPDGSLVAPGSNISTNYMVIEPADGEENSMVFDRRTGEQITDAYVDKDGVINLPDGSLAISASETTDRYLVAQDKLTGDPVIFDRRTGMELTNATLHHNGMIRLATGQLVAPSSREGSKYMVVTDEDDQTLLVYDRFTGEQIKGAQVDANGLIRFEDGRMAVEPRTGDHIKDAVYSEDGLIRFTDGRRVAPGSTDNSSQYLIYFDPATKENLVFDRHTGEQIEGATVDSRGLILLPDGKLHLDQNQVKHRYIVLQDVAENATFVVDTKSGQKIDGATVLINGLVKLPDGSLVAPGSNISTNYMVIEPADGEENSMVFDRRTGEQITDAYVDKDGVINLPDGSLAISASETTDRYLVAQDKLTGDPVIFDRRTGMELTNATLHHNGMIRLATGQLVAPSSREGSKYMVVTDEDDQTLLVYDRFTGEQIKGAQVDANGLIRFEDGRMAVEPSSKLDRYAILTDPNNGEKLVFDRRTGDHIKDAVYSEDGLIRFTDGRRVAPGSTDNSSQYLIYFDPATKENLVFDRHTGEQIEGATVDSRGLILLPDGKLHLDQNQVKHRYIVLQDVAENATFVVDTKSGQKIDGATVLINGLVKLPDGSLVAPGSNISTNYMVIEPADGEENSMVFDRRTGEQITDAYVDKDGVINLPDGSLAISASETTDRYLVAQDKLTGDPVIFDRRTGMELTNATLHHNGMIRLATGQLVAPSSREGSKYMVVTDEDDQTLLVYDRFTGEQIKGAQVDANGLIRFEDGRMAVEPSSKLDRYAILTDPNNGEKLVFDRRTGDHIKDAVYSEDGLIRFTDGRRVAPGSTDNSSQYLIYFDPATKENLVFDRHTGEQIEGATVDSRGLILLPDGKLHLDQNQVKHRYIVLQDVAENATFVVDTKSGQKIDGATVLINGLVKLPDGSLVAPGSNISTNYMVIEPADGEENSMVFDRRTGEQITDAYVDKDGVINLPDGSLAISASETTDRYLVAQDKLTGDPVIFDRRTGMELTNATLHHNGMIRLATGQLVAPSSREGSKYMVVTDEDDQTLLVYDRFTGEQIKGAQVDANGLIRFEDGRMAVEPSSKLDRYAILTDPNNGEKLVFDRRTGDHIKDAVYSEDGLIRFTDGRRVAPGSTDNSSQYLIYFDPATKENLVFDRHTGEQIEGATVDDMNMIHLPDGDLFLQPHILYPRYISLSHDIENISLVLDSSTGEFLSGTYLGGSFFRLNRGEVIAIGNLTGGRFVVYDNFGVPVVYDTLLGNVVPGAFLRSDGWIQFPDGLIFPVLSSVPNGQRYFVFHNSSSGHFVVYDAILGVAVLDSFVDDNGIIHLANGSLFTPISYNHTSLSMDDLSEPAYASTLRERNNASLNQMVSLNSTTEMKPEEMDLISPNKIDKITNASSCECIEDLFRRGLLRLKGEKGDRGDPGPAGPEGPPGTCPATCGSNPSTVIQGPKGDPGSPGVCTIDQCKEAAIPGPQGPPGEKGEKGDPGVVNLTSDQSVSIIKQAIEDFILQPEIQKQFRGPKGDPGECSCLSDAAETSTPKKYSPNKYDESNGFKNNLNPNNNNNGEISGYGAMVLDTEMDLSKVSHTFPVGTMAYIKEADTFYLKTIEQTNTWRIISLLSKADAVNLPIPKPTPAPVFEPQYYPVHKGKKLYLIAQNEPLRGDLKHGDRITGAHAGSIFACQRAANLKGLGRAFYPLLSTDMFNMDYVVPPTYRYGVPLVNLYGEVLFDDFMSLVEGRSRPQAKILNFDGADIADDIVAPCIWIGQKPIYLNGDYEYAAQSKCRNWQSTYPGENGLAVSLPIVDNAPGLFSKQNFKLISCSKLCRMLCIQITPSEI
ncbi:Collagen alpha-1(XV) chain [Schistosoma japonicum]|nr:Collagen alpha-1(XV) chain [Schistosoma japonicum]